MGEWGEGMKSFIILVLNVECRKLKARCHNILLGLLHNYVVMSLTNSQPVIQKINVTSIKEYPITPLEEVAAAEISF